MWVALANAKATHIFSAKNIRVYAIFNDQIFKDTLTDDIVSFKQLGPDVCLFCLCWGFTALSTQWGHVKRGQLT